MVRAYHVNISFYGFWLPNDPRGSNSSVVRSWRLLPFGKATKVTTRRSVAHVPHDRAKRLAAKKQLQYRPVVLTGIQARAVARGFASMVEKSGYVLYACAIMPTHVHLVIARHRYKIEQVVNLLKGAATRQLTAEGLHPMRDQVAPGEELPSPWGVSMRVIYLDTDEFILDEIGYVERNPLKDGMPRQYWSFVVPFKGRLPHDGEPPPPRGGAKPRRD
jgi:REP element-mobilizing transposase RayT